ncbi:hypothetical protein F0562_008995 [Nyssa sinensis]|uniref:Uncharacterized protein n=1 Tax=Nyssa sinensis TaxID=561372 RepID=A0A5J5AAD5_9ASTE|nr:hypothetical protein F0562_008995 [Nyssa sinensis]
MSEQVTPQVLYSAAAECPSIRSSLQVCKCKLPRSATNFSNEEALLVLPAVKGKAPRNAANVQSTQRPYTENLQYNARTYACHRTESWCMYIIEKPGIQITEIDFNFKGIIS